MSQIYPFFHDNPRAGGFGVGNPLTVSDPEPHMNSGLGSADFPSPRRERFPGFYFRLQFFKHFRMVHAWESLVFISRFARLWTCSSVLRFIHFIGDR
jgi:hypothetical protein